VGSLLIAALALAGWLTETLYILAADLPENTVTGWRILAGEFRASHVPMAPVTAGAFLLLGFALLAHLRNPAGRRTSFAILVAALVVAGWASLKVADLIVSIDLEDNLVGDRGKSGKIAAGIMSPLTGGSFLLMCAALLLLRWGRGPRSHVARATCLLLLALANLLILGGYIHGTPLLYGGNIVPVALTTAVAFLLLTTAAIAAAGPTYFPLSPLVGPSARATLLRTVVPVTAASVLIVGALLSRVYSTFDYTIFKEDGYKKQIPVLVSALIALVSAGVGTLIVLQIARRIGGSIDRAEAARLQALQELREARDVAEASNRAKSQFLANMSHELRTPLNAIIGYAEMLNEEADDNGLEESKPDLDRILHSARHLLSLINEILDLSKIEAGKVELCPESFDVGAMIRDAATTIRPVVEKKANRFVLDCADNLGVMCADVTRLRQCLFNLLSNAGKFTEKGAIILRVRRESGDGDDWLTFAVIDSGIGIPPE
jgi:signal transduction histidine kinase